MATPRVEAPKALVEIGEFFGVGFQPVLNFEGWRVAMKRFADSTHPTTFHSVDRHNETNEVFILTEGRADMLLMEVATRRLRSTSFQWH